MKRADIEELAIVKLEEYSPYAPTNTSAGPLLGGGDILKEVKPIYSYVSESIVDAGNEIMRIAPINYLIPEEYSARCIVDPMRPLTGKFELPDDYLRLHTLQMCGWMREIHSAVLPEDPNFNDQMYPATCGHEYKPVATQVLPWMHYYSVPCCECHRIKKMLYIATYDKTPDFTKAVGELIALNCAKKVYEVFGNTEQANMMAAEMKSKLENLTK